MGLQRNRFQVYVTRPDGDLAELVAEISHQDLLRGEAAHLGQPGVSLDNALALTTAWCWASLMRQGDYAGAWPTFRDQDCQGIERLEAVDVDPTIRETPDTSPSSSQPSSEDPQPGG